MAVAVINTLNLIFTPTGFVAGGHKKKKKNNNNNNNNNNMFGMALGIGCF
jgi:hypothetical protein